MDELVSLIYVADNPLETAVRMFIVFICILIVNNVIKYLGKLT